MISDAGVNMDVRILMVLSDKEKETIADKEKETIAEVHRLRPLFIT
jgi:hypothetical protein